ncbi:MAG: hypothetical protein AAF726_05125 [Planctomycetota bacterium]
MKQSATEPTDEPLDLATQTREVRDRSATSSRTLLEAARADDAGYDALMEAARALTIDADLRVRSALALDPGATDLPSPDALIAAEDDLPGDLKAEVRSLSTTIEELTERALELRPDDPDARLYRTLGMGLTLWSLPVVQAMGSGATRALPGEIKSLAAEHPALEGAAPLRLAGRFKTRAPWPLRDLETGRDQLERACELAPIPLNLLFLGDAQWLCGDEEAAVATWQRATTAEADEETSDTAPLVRELARLRVLSAEAQT